MPEQAGITLLIVEDQLVTRLGLRLVAERFDDLTVIDEAENGAAAVMKALDLHPHVVLMDIGLPGMDGIEAARQIKLGAPEIKILIITGHDNDDDLFAALAAGADGYCLKDAEGEQIAMAIRAVYTGAAWLAPGIAHRVLQACRYDSSRGVRVDTRGKFFLSTRELEVLALVVEGLSNPEIASRLSVSQDTVKTHVRHIMEKMVVSDRTQAAVKALKEGLINH